MFPYRINGVPACANKNLLSSTLRDLWRFKGYVVSDANAVDYISTQHHYRDTTWDSVTEAVKAGVNLELASEHHVIYNEQVCSKTTFLCDSYAQGSRSIRNQTKLRKTMSMIKHKTKTRSFALKMSLYLCTRANTLVLNQEWYESNFGKKL